MQNLPTKSLQDLFLFREIANTQSFRMAAEKYHLSPSAVSHSISQLETQLAVRLFNRSTRKVSLTQVGESLLHELNPALQQIERSFIEVQSHQEQIQGIIRLTLPKGAEDMITSVIADFSHQFPKVGFDIDVSDRLKDIISDRYDAGIRFEEKLQDDWVALPIHQPYQFCVVATPIFLNNFGLPRKPQELVDFDCINIRFPSGKIYQWEFEMANRKYEIEVRGKITTSEMSQVIKFVKNNLGIGYVYYDKVKQDLAEGKLIQILSEYMPSAEKFYLYYPSRKFNTPAFKAFLTWIKNFNSGNKP